MKKSEVMKELLSSYYFQHGRKANDRVVTKAIKIMNSFEKDEKQREKDENDKSQL